MKFECCECRKLFEGKKLVLRLNGTVLEPLCKKCYEKTDEGQPDDFPQL